MSDTLPMHDPSAVEAAAPEPTASTPALFRARVQYARLEALRYVSHLEIHQVWERTLRRAGVLLAYSQGFNPHPRLHLASALPLGFLSRCEICDFWMTLPEGAPPPDAGTILDTIQAAAPPGLTLSRVELVALALPPLQTQVEAAEYTALPYDPIDLETLARRAAELTAQAALPRERRGKPYDLRLLIEALEARPAAQGAEVHPDAPAMLFMRLTAREGATGRPEEVLDALGLDPSAFRVERSALILKPAGA